MLTDNERITMTLQILKNYWSLRWLVVISASACLGVLNAQAGDAPMAGMKMGGTQMETDAATIDVSAYPKAVQDSLPAVHGEVCAMPPPQPHHQLRSPRFARRMGKHH